MVPLLATVIFSHILYSVLAVVECGLLYIVGNLPGKEKKKKIRNSKNSYVATADSVQEMELNTKTKHCSAKSEK